MIAVTTRSYTPDRAGVNSHETILTAPAVATRGIKLLHSIHLPGDARGAEAQPLVVPGVSLRTGQKRDVLAIATLANTVQLHDANTGEPLFPPLLLGTPIKSTKEIDSWHSDVPPLGGNDHFGILSTPVIDAANGILYACCWISPDGSVGKARHYLAAVSLVSGTQAKPLLDLEGAVYDPGGVPVQRFASAARKQRASLLFAPQHGTRGTVFIPFGSVWESASSNRGWIVAVDVGMWRVTCAWCSAVNGSGGGIWQAGSGLAMDAEGYIYAMTGNGDFAPPYEWGQCFLKFKYAPPGKALLGSLEVVDHWSPFLDSVRSSRPAKPLAAALEAVGNPAPTSLRKYALRERLAPPNAAGNRPLDPAEAVDMDLGSGGPVLIEELGIGVGSGKDGVGYAFALHNMGGTKPEQLRTAAGVEANYRKPPCLPWWLTFFPGYSVSPMPDDIRDLNYLFGSRTHHQHGSLIVWKGPQGWRMLCWGENSQLRLWSIEAAPSPGPGIVKIKQPTFLASGEEFASPQADVPPGGMPGAMMCLSYDAAHPNNTAILYACVPYGDANREVTRGRLLLYDLNQFKEGRYGAVIPKLWDSADWGPEHEFWFNKFCPPTVANGRLFVPTFGADPRVYGLA